MMKKEKKLSVPLKDEVLRNQIHQAVHEFSVIQLYVFPTKTSGYTDLFILMQDWEDAETLRQRKWITTSVTRYNVRIFISYVDRVRLQLKLGNPFYVYYTQPSALIWQRNADATPIPASADRETFIRNMQLFRKRFDHDHQLLMKETSQLDLRHLYASAFLSYLPVFQHHIEYLELLFTGNISVNQDLQTRLSRLSIYIPEIREIFRMKNGNTSQLIRNMKASIKAAARGKDESAESSEWYETVKSAELQLYRMTVARFSEFSKILRFIPSRNNVASIHRKPVGRKVSPSAGVRQHDEICMMYKTVIYTYNKNGDRSNNGFIINDSGID
nr:hypothetical protein [uncultured Chryseobacterium sp.]